MSLIVRIDNSRPVELSSFTASLAAVGDQFKRFVAHEGGIDPETRLYVHEIRSGSIVAELIELGKTANDLWEQRDYIAPFVPALADTVNAVLNLTDQAKLLDRRTIRNVANITAPIAVDNGSTLQVIDNRGGTVVNNFIVDPHQAAAIQHNAQHLLNSEFPDEIRFENEPMILFQLRDAPPGKTGDFGIIDRFSSKPGKLFFAGDAVKSAILHENGNPFERVFWVSGYVKTAGGRVAGYMIHQLLEATDKED